MTASSSELRARPLVERMRELEGGGAVARYAALVVGCPGLASLVRYELIAGLAGRCPGALGYWLRRRLVPRLFATMGPGGALGRGLTLRCPGQIRLGRNVTIDDDVTLDAKGRGGIVLGDDVYLGRGAHFACTDGSVRVGSFVSIGPGVYVAAKGDVTVGSCVGIGPRAMLISGGHGVEADAAGTPMLRQPRSAKPIAVGDDVLIGAGAIVLEGITIGPGAVVAAGAVVAGDVPPRAIVGGIPARLLRMRPVGPADGGGA